MRHSLAFGALGHSCSVQISFLWISRIAHDCFLRSSMNHAFTPYMYFWEIKLSKFCKLNTVHLLCSFFFLMVDFIQSKERVLRVCLDENQPILKHSCLESTQCGNNYFMNMLLSYLNTEAYIKIRYIKKMKDKWDTSRWEVQKKGLSGTSVSLMCSGSHCSCPSKELRKKKSRLLRINLVASVRKIGTV